MGKKLSLEEKQNKLLIINPNIEIINQFYKQETKRTFCNCKCKICGHTFEADWGNLNRGKSCPKCARKLLTLEDRQEIITKKGVNATILKVFSKERGKTVRFKDTYCLCKCDKDGYIWEGMWGNLNKGRGCPKCSNSNIRYSIKDIQNFVDRMNMNLTIISKKINKINNHSKTFIQCKCNKDDYVWETQLSNLFQGKGCPMCSGSNLETITENVLRKLNIDFKIQFRFEECKDKYPLPFDIYIKEYNIAIELDGEQHFKPTQFGGILEEESINNFLKNKKHDEIKNKFCLENNIKLIRIPYFEIDNIENIIKKSIIC